MDDELKLLFEPFDLKGRRLRNRVVWLPHLTGYAKAGKVTEQHIAYYVERARGGVGTIIMGCDTVDPIYSNHLRVDAFDPKNVPLMQRLSDAVHEHDTLLIGQLTDDGNQNTASGSLDWAYERAPSAVPDAAYQIVPKVMELEDIERSIHYWALCASHHRDGGYDGTELKVGHDGLPRQMMSPFYNRREDEYGGSRSNRLRYLREVLQAIRQAVGEEHLLGMRYVFDEFVSGGYELEEGLLMLEEIEQWGLVDYITSDLGVHTALRFCNPPMETPEGFARYASRAAKSRVDLPIIAYGRIRKPAMAEAILRQGDADLVGLARALITDPDWVRKAQEGRTEDIRKCIGCNQGCLDRLWKGQQITCILNPAAGREAKWGAGTIRQTTTPKRILVIGGGPAGMKAAEVAARRGHSVTIVDRSDQLGGAVNTLSRVPWRWDFADGTRWIERQLWQLGVTVHLGFEVTAEDGRLAASAITSPAAIGTKLDIAADVVVLATGARPARPDIPGVWSADVVDVPEVLHGADVGPRAVVYDTQGAVSGCSTAKLLADAGREVTIVTPSWAIGQAVGPPLRQTFLPQMFQSGVEGLENYELVEIDMPFIRFVHTMDGSSLELSADTLVLDTGRTSNDGLKAALESIGVEVHAIGDCAAPRDVGMAIYSGEDVGRKL
jgi:2,4-dienoyl-CoA reductase-like NADH-dependent reductase (Old Yellow Enzyme family)/thioredoxin reductase